MPCFYVNPNNPAQRLAMGLKDLGPARWGPHFNHFPTDQTQLNDSDEHFYIGGLDSNKQTGFTVNWLKSSELLDDTGENLKAFSPNVALGELGFTVLDVNVMEHNAGEVLPWGMQHTLKIIRHRNVVLSDSAVNLPIPQASDAMSEYDNALLCLDNVAAANGSVNFKELYWPAATLCYAYQPAVKAGEQLSDKLKAHNWFLPSFGDGARVMAYIYFDKEFSSGFRRAISDGVIQFADKYIAWSSSREGWWNAYAYSSNNVINSQSIYFNYSCRPCVAF